MNISLWLPKTRYSNPVSKLLRPLFEAKKAKTAAAESSKGGVEAGGAAGDIQIQSVIRKSASGETQDTTVIGNAAEQAGQTGQDKKKEPAPRVRRKSPKKS